MSDTAKTMPQAPAGRAVRLLRLVVRVLLGLFVLWQIVFLPTFNLLDNTEDLRGGLAEERRQDGPCWRLLHRIPGLGPLVQEWLNKGDNPADPGMLGNLIERPRRVVRWWAQTTGQEQGWGLFAPNTPDYAPFPSVELRWDAPDEAAASGRGAVAGEPAALVPAPRRPVAHEPVVLWSENQPPDRRHYLRFGGFRRRRIDAQFEMRFCRDGQPRENAAKLWEQQIRERVLQDSPLILAFLRWRLARFQREHPGLSPPAQVVLRVQTFAIPAPPGPHPWDWDEEEPMPVARWLPEQRPAELQSYCPTEDRFRRD